VSAEQCAELVAHRDHDPHPYVRERCAALIYLAFGTRTAGVVLLLTVVLLDPINYRRLGSYALAVSLLDALFISLHLVVIGGEVSYVD
jgi:hypothetical protein